MSLGKTFFFLSTDSENILKSIKTTATTLVRLTVWTESVPGVGQRGASDVQKVFGLCGTLKTQTSPFPHSSKIQA